MANHKSAQKRAIQSKTRRLRNRIVKTRVKNIIQDLRLAIGNKLSTEVNVLLNKTKAVIDNAAKKGVMHKKTASRKISRLSKMANKIMT